MNSSSYIILGFLAALIASPFLLRRFSHSDTDEYGAFAVGNRRFGWFRIAAGLSATFIGGASVINLAGLGYTFGWYGLTDVVATSAGLVLSALLVLPAVMKGRGISLGSFLERSHKMVGIAAGALSTVVYTLITAAQILALTRLLQPHFPVAPSVIALILTTAVSAYILYGGYSSVTVTDVIQFLVMTVCYLGVVGMSLVFAPPSIATAIAAKVMPFDLMSLLALPLLFVPVSQDVHIRMNSAKSLNHAKAGILIAAVYYCIFGMVSVLIGTSMAKHGRVIQSPDQVVPEFLGRSLGAWAIVPTVAIVAVIVSTLDSVLFASASSLSYDLVDRLRQRPLSGKDSARPRWATIAVLVAALFIALRAQGVLSLILSALILYVSVLLPAVLGTALGKDGRAVGWLAVIVLVAVCLAEASGFSMSYRAYAFSLVHLALVAVLPKK